MAEDREAPTVREGQGAHAPDARVEPRDPAGRYKPLREIARGGMGRVVEAIDTQLSRTVAVKEILDEHPDARARFEREVEITARLEHPSIVPLYDSGTSADGAPFYVMRKVTGEPLDAKIRAAATLDQRLRLLPNVLAVADAIAHAHARGVIHRDLKPANVLVGALGETIVIDWGLAKLIGERDIASPAREAGDSLHTVAGTVFGTPGFMAPEQVAGEDVDERADVYALGACLYHVLAGKPPFHGSSESEVFERTRAAAPESLGALVAGVPPDLVTIVEKAMAREKAERYLDAGGFSEDLRRFLGGQLVAAHHYPIRARITRWLRRHRALVAVVALAAVTLVVVGVWALRRVFAEQARAEAALAREQARGDDLLLFQAQAYLETDPTLAAASLQQLPATSPHWASLGPMVAAIRARGVARAYPTAPGRMHFVEVAPTAGDERVLVSAIGVARLLDLTARTTTTLAEDSGVLRSMWCGSHIVIFRRETTDWIDAKTHAIGSPPWPRTARTVLCADDGTVFYLDKGVVILDPKTSVTSKVEIPDATSIDITRSGRWLAVTSQTRVVVHRVDKLAVTEAFVHDARSSVMAFDLAERRLAISTDTEIVEIDLEQSPPVIRRRWPERPIGLLHYIDDRLRRVGFDHQIAQLDAVPNFVTSSVGMLSQIDLAGREATIVDDHRITIVATSERYALHAPEAVDVIAATRDGRFLVAAGSAKVFAWDLDEFVSRRSVVPAGESLAYVGTTGLIGLRSAGELVDTYRYAVAPDLAVKELVKGKQLVTSRLAAHPDGLVVITDLSGRATIVEPVKLEIEVANTTVVQELDASTLLVATEGGAIHRVDRRTAKSIGVLADVGFHIVALAARSGTIIALADDGRIWRRDASGHERRTTITPWASATIDENGVVFIGRDRELLEWGTSEPKVAATFLQELRGPAIWYTSPREVLVSTKDGAFYRFDRKTRTTSLIVATSRFAVAQSGVGAVLDGGITILDAASGKSFRLVEQLATFDGALAMASDGSSVIAAEPYGDQALLHAWRITLANPHDWIMQATNAIAPATPGGAIVWRP